jgi:uncharacterized membrane-anchored protein
MIAHGYKLLSQKYSCLHSFVLEIGLFVGESGLYVLVPAFIKKYAKVSAIGIITATLVIQCRYISKFLQY